MYGCFCCKNKSNGGELDYGGKGLVEIHFGHAT